MILLVDLFVMRAQGTTIQKPFNKTKTTVKLATTLPLLKKIQKPKHHDA